MILAQLLVAAALQAEDRAAPRRPVAGLEGVTTVSRVVFVGQPDTTYRFEASYVFPDRARWELRIDDGGRRLESRFGTGAYLLAQGSATSTPYQGEDLHEVLRRLELRRAVLLFPDGWEWDRAANERRAQLDPLPASEPDAEPQPLGELVARIAEDGRLTSMAVHRPNGTEQEALDVRDWQEVAGRAWPARLRLRVDGQVVWDETVEEVDLGRRYLDAFFVPPDRRDDGHEPSPPGVVQTTELPPMLLRSFALPADTSWDAARARADDVIAGEAERWTGTSRELDTVPRFEVDELGRPTAVVVRLLPADGKVPAGWTRIESRLGLTLVLDHVGQLTRSRIMRVLGRVPDDARPALGYVRHVGDPKTGRIQLVVPLLPREDAR